MWDVAHLGELFELQNISMSSSTQNPLPLSGHILILLSDGLQLSANRPINSKTEHLLHALKQILHIFKIAWHSEVMKVLLPSLDAETVLDKDSDAEENHALYGHSKEILAHHVPRQRRAESIFTWKHSETSCQKKQTQNWFNMLRQNTQYTQILGWAIFNHCLIRINYFINAFHYWINYIYIFFSLS